MSPKLCALDEVIISEDGIPPILWPISARLCGGANAPDIDPKLPVTERPGNVEPDTPSDVGGDVWSLLLPTCE